MTITPDQARELLDGATPGPWDASFDDEADATRLYPWCEDEEIDDGESWELARNAPGLAQTIAGMREEWAVEMYHDVDDTWRQYTTWVATREGASQHLTADLGWARQYRLVRRLVGPVEPEA